MKKFILIIVFFVSMVGVIGVRTISAQTKIIYFTYKPNPVISRINITADPAIVKKIEIRNLLGKTEITTTSVSDLTILDVNDLPEGIYIITAYGDNNKHLQTTKFYIKK